MQWLIRNMTAPPGIEGLTVVQAMGNIDASVGPYDALELGRILAKRWCGKFLILNTPAMLPDVRTRKTLLGLDSVCSVVEQLKGVRRRLSEWARSTIPYLLNGAYSAKRIRNDWPRRARWERSAAGSTTATETMCSTSYRDRVISIDFADLRRADDVIARGGRKRPHGGDTRGPSRRFAQVTSD